MYRICSGVPIHGLIRKHNFRFYHFVLWYHLILRERERERERERQTDRETETETETETERAILLLSFGIAADFKICRNIHRNMKNMLRKTCNMKVYCYDNF